MQEKLLMVKGCNQETFSRVKNAVLTPAFQVAIPSLPLVKRLFSETLFLQTIERLETAL